MLVPIRNHDIPAPRGVDDIPAPRGVVVDCILHVDAVELALLAKFCNFVLHVVVEPRALGIAAAAPVAVRPTRHEVIAVLVEWLPECQWVLC